MQLRRRMLALPLLSLVVMTLAGCPTDEEDPTTKRELALPNILEDGNQAFRHDSTQVEGLPEGVVLVSTYTTDYEAEDWRITDTKSLNIGVTAEMSPTAPYDIFVESLHADVVLMSKKPATDGLNQDTMDDSLHSGTQPGFYITGHPYTEQFIIEGRNQSFLEGYMNIWDGYGYGALEDHRPRECEFRGDGRVKGNKFHIVINVVIVPRDEPFGYKVSFADEFQIPVSKMSCNS